jgi:hypothetical protein
VSSKVTNGRNGIVPALAWNNIEFGSIVLNGIDIGPTFTHQQWCFLGDGSCWPFAVVSMVTSLGSFGFGKRTSIPTSHGSSDALRRLLKREWRLSP